MPSHDKMPSSVPSSSTASEPYLSWELILNIITLRVKADIDTPTIPQHGSIAQDNFRLAAVSRTLLHHVAKLAEESETSLAKRLTKLENKHHKFCKVSDLKVNVTNLGWKVEEKNVKGVPVEACVGPDMVSYPGWISCRDFLLQALTRLQPERHRFHNELWKYQHIVRDLQVLQCRISMVHVADLLRAMGY